MKKIMILIILLFSAVAFTQTPNWTSVKETNINYGNSVSFDIFTNSDGNHIIIQESNALKYYKMNVNGIAGTPVILEASSVVSPSITGDATMIYVVYRKSNETYLRTKYSTNGGSTWAYLSSIGPVPSNSNASSIESVLSNNNLHITYQVRNQVLYICRPLTPSGIWTTPFIVSGTETGTLPRIAAWHTSTEDKVYFIYKNSTTTGKFREYNVSTKQWQPIRTGYNLNPSNLNSSSPAGFTVGGDWLYYYYSFTTANPYQIYFQLRILTKNGGFISESFAEPNQTYRVHTTTTSNGNSYTAYWYRFVSELDFESGLYRDKNYGTQFYPKDQIYWNVNQQEVIHPPVNLSSAGNDVHVLWKDNLGLNNGNNLRYIYDDQTPLAPQNLQLNKFRSGSNYFVEVSWNVNVEADLSLYEIWRKVVGTGCSAQDWQFIGTSTTNSYIDYDYFYGGSCYLYYKVRVKDIGNHYSNFSAEISGSGGIAPKLGENGEKETVSEYFLSNNYPNPFNPTTTIDYSIKSAGLVTLKVYDMLGTEVASLVNDNKEAGNYSVEFNAANLPSGIYFYTLTSGDFTSTKKLILLK